MGSFHKLLERLGFVRLRDFGLILTPDRRILTMRSEILDDGFGGRVVGWVDGDLATMELPKWGAPAPKPVVKPRPAPLPSRPSPPITVQVPPKPVAVAPAPAPEKPPEEDEWEWEIAVARARATEVVPPPPVAAPAPYTASQWLANERTSSNEDTAIRPMTPRSVPAPLLARSSEQKLAVGSPPRTIIPVPTLPPAVDPRLVRPHEDVTRQLVPAPRRFPRATDQRIAAAPDDDHTSPTVISMPVRARHPARR